MDSKAPPPYLPAKYEIADATALKAVARGDATPDQQVRAIKFIVEGIAGVYDLEYRTDDRDHAFASGRRFTGLQIVKLINIDLSTIRKPEQPKVEE